MGSSIPNTPASARFSLPIIVLILLLTTPRHHPLSPCHHSSPLQNSSNSVAVSIPPRLVVLRISELLTFRMHEVNPASHSPTTLATALTEVTVLIAEAVVLKRVFNDNTPLLIFGENINSRDEAARFLGTVKELQHAMELFVGSKDKHGQEMLGRAHRLTQDAMNRLQKEFYQLLSTNRHSLDFESLHPSTIPTATSCSSLVDDLCALGLAVADESIWHEIPPSVWGCGMWSRGLGLYPSIFGIRRSLTYLFLSLMDTYHHPLSHLARHANNPPPPSPPRRSPTPLPPSLFHPIQASGTHQLFIGLNPTCCLTTYATVVRPLRQPSLSPPPRALAPHPTLRLASQIFSCSRTTTWRFHRGNPPPNPQAHCNGIRPPSPPITTNHHTECQILLLYQEPMFLHASSLSFMYRI